MAALFQFDDFTHGYVELARAVRDGDHVAPRGAATREVRNAVFTVADPRRAVAIGVGRNLPTKIVAAETLQFLSGWSDLRQVDAAAGGRFMQFSDDGQTLAGAYGPRMFLQLFDVVEKLKADRDSRQAGLTLWDYETTGMVTKDLPCTVVMFFDVRADRLNMTVFMRSSDIWLGIPIDVAVFTRIQGAVAWALGTELGEYTHHSRSLHVYERDLERLDELHPPAHDDATIPMPTDGLTQPSYDPWTKVVSSAMAAARHEHTASAGLEWYAAKLAGLPIGERFCGHCRRWTDEGYDKADGHRCVKVRDW